MSIKQEDNEFLAIDDEEDFIPPNFFDDLLNENVAQSYVEKYELADMQEMQNQYFTTLQENNFNEMHNINCEISNKLKSSFEENELHTLDSDSNYSKLENLNPSTRDETLDNMKKELNSEQNISVQKSCDDQNDLNENTRNFYSARNNLPSLDDNYIRERLQYIRKEIRYLRLYISKNPPANILTKLTYHLAAYNNERILLEKYDNSAYMVHTQLKKSTYAPCEQHLQLNTAKKPYTRKVNNYIKIPVKSCCTTKIYNQYVHYNSSCSSNQYYQANIRSSFYNEHINYSNHIDCNDTEYLNTYYKPFESIDYMTKESKLNRLSDLQKTLRNCVNLPNEQFNYILSEIIKIHIYLLRYKDEINARFERESNCCSKN